MTDEEPQQSAETADFNVYVGAETGILKAISINPKMNLAKNFSNLQALEKQHEITCMSWGSAGEEQTEILLGLRNQVVRTFDPADKSFTSSIERPGGSGPLVGVAKVGDSIVTAAQSGLVKVWRDDKPSFDTIEHELCSSTKGKLKRLRKDREEEEENEELEKHLASLKADRSLCRMIQVPFHNHLVATGGKENDLQLWDLNVPESGPVFRAKNVPQDSLQLRVPVWITDICFPTRTDRSSIAVVSRHGHVRLYDTRGQQRRPVLDMNWPDEVLTAITSTFNANEVIVGTSGGHIGQFDIRQTHKGLHRKYRGCVGGIRSLDAHPQKPYFAAVGLDRFLRVFDINQPKPVQKMYLKSRLNSVLLTKDFDPAIPEQERQTTKVTSQKTKKSEVLAGHEEGDEFWAKLPVIREKKGKRGRKVQEDTTGKRTKK